MVRTGRMSCSLPNMQQLSFLAKELIIPPPGHAIVTADSSQLEFRLIGAYTQNERVLAAYNADPWTDFHQLVADSAGTKRKPAKTINFMMGYGGGKKRTVEQLTLNEDIVEEAAREVEANGVHEDMQQHAVAELCKQRALSLYAWYHRDMLPELKPTSNMAASVARKRGFARNWYGRRRHLPSKRAHIAFNTLCQSTAGDYFKERMVALRDELPWFVQATQVHDCVLGYVPLEMVEDEETERRTLTAICEVMNDAHPPTRPFPVPFRTAIGWSDKNWQDASTREQKPV
jgi:DNA polymerase I-like protein with 3'-5' exonuclease and polymerase domains